MSEIARKAWTDHDRHLLGRIWEGWQSIQLAALMLDRSPSSIQTQASRMGLPARLAETNENHRRPWSDEDDQTLHRVARSLRRADGKLPIIEVSRQVGRSIDTVVERLLRIETDRQALYRRLYLPELPEPPKVKDTRSQSRLRPCLTCGKKFQSWGAGNRICKKCKESSPGW